VDLTKLTIAINERTNEALSMQLSGQIDYIEKQYKFGLGVSLHI
jgi:hypothetical protein